MDYLQAAEALAPQIIANRRHLHQNPELSLQESETATFVCAALQSYGLDFVRLADHSVIAKLVGSGISEQYRGDSAQHRGKSLALRADMDALPIQEETSLPFASNKPGIMHACGHDGHTAILLGAAQILSTMRERLSGTLYFCFQPAEEVQGGAKLILDYLEKEGGVDCVAAIHLWADIPSGSISLESGARMAAGDFFSLEVFGAGGHASRPDLCVDPIKPLCETVLKLSALPVNRIAAHDSSVVHIGKISAGTAGNVFPASASAEGGIRSFSSSSREKLKALLPEIAAATAASYGASAKLTLKSGTPMIYNEPARVAFARRTVEQHGLFELDPFEPIFASEDFGFYLEKYPGFMAFVGIRNEAKGLVYTQHHPRFDIDESVLAKTAAFFTAFACDYLS